MSDEMRCRVLRNILLSVVFALGELAGFRGFFTRSFIHDTSPRSFLFSRKSTMKKGHKNSNPFFFRFFTLFHNLLLFLAPFFFQFFTLFPNLLQSSTFSLRSFCSRFYVILLHGSFTISLLTLGSSQSCSLPATHLSQTMDSGSRVHLLILLTSGDTGPWT